MVVDKNLFLYNLAFVLTVKNEAPYIKEWLDYHILAGADHFYIYDHESPDNLKEILKPYIERGVVTYQIYPDKFNMMTIYNEALQKYRFLCRYMTFIDADEFIYPKSNRSITEVVDEILADRPNVGGLAINWQCFGSNGQEKADYSKGVLERFTRRAVKDYHNFEKDNFYYGNIHVKTITNPRRVHFLDNPHFPQYFEGNFASNENGVLIHGFNNPVTVEKIAVNHYYLKSKEECQKRRNLKDASLERWMKRFDLNDEFDDGILKYREARCNALLPQGEGGGGNAVEILVRNKQINYQKTFNAAIQNLAPVLNQNISQEFFKGKMETFLTCRTVISQLKKNLLDEFSGKLFEETALKAIYQTLNTNLLISDIRLLIAELPNILILDYPVIEKIRQACINIIYQMRSFWSAQVGKIDRYILWKQCIEFDYILEMLKTFDSYKHK